LALNLLPLIVISVGVVGRLPIAGYETLWSDIGAYEYGRQFTAGRQAEVSRTLRGFASLMFLSVVYLVVYRSAAVDSALDTDSKVLLTAVEPVVLIGAEMLVLVAFAGRFLGLILVVGAVAFSFGAGAPLIALSSLLAGLALVVTAVSLTYPAVLGMQALLQRINVVRDVKTAVAGLAFFGMVGVLISLRQSFELLSTFPTGWYVDFALGWTARQGIPVRGLAAVSATPVSLVAGFWFGTRFATVVWFSDEDTHTVNGSTGLDLFAGWVPLETVLSNQVATVVRANWARLRREPRVFLISGLFLVVTLTVTYSAAQRYPNLLPFVVIIYGATAVGAGPTLNPLGNQGPVLNAVLTTRDGGTLLILGTALAVGIPGSILVGAAAGLAAVGSGYSLSLLVAVTILGGATGLSAPFISLAIGIYFPNVNGFDPVGDRSMHTPRLEAVLLLLGVLLAVGTPALVLFSGTTVPDGGSLDSLTSSIIGIALSLCVCVLTGMLSYAHARSLMNEYEIGA
jgi:hypothetical protein